MHLIITKPTVLSTVLLALLLLDALDETHSLVFIVAMPIVVELCYCS